MKKANFKPIFIVGNWKTGSTLLQFLLAKDNKICNIFPDKINTDDYDGSSFWKLYNCHVLIRNTGTCITKEIMKVLNKDLMIEHLNELCDREYGLLKRPQFVTCIPFIKWLLPDVQLLGIKRDIYGVVYSYIRSNTAWRRNNHGMKIGLKPPGWFDMVRKSVIEYAVWTNYYAESILDQFNIPCISYEKICDNTDDAIKDLSKILNIDLDINYETITNLNSAVKEGTKLVSRNRETLHGRLDIGKSDKIEVPPMTKEQKDEVKEMCKKYKNLKVTDDVIFNG